MGVEKKFARTGVPGLDDILEGGLTVGNVFLLEGHPGTGKTTIALRSLLSGAEALWRRDSSCLGYRRRTRGT